MFVYATGILCGTITGKKKKKMMYLTARNAGEHSILISHWLILSWLILLIGFVLGLPDCVVPHLLISILHPHSLLLLTDNTTFSSVIGLLLCVPLCD